MTPRSRQVALGCVFWIAFAPIAIVGILLQPLTILIYALGNENIRAFIYRTGKALDQFDNALLFGGEPQETISSHAGRYILSGQPMPWKFRFVKWLTDKFEYNHCVGAVEDVFKDSPL
jgi:hypothetical protein